MERTETFRSHTQKIAVKAHLCRGCNGERIGCPVADFFTELKENQVNIQTAAANSAMTEVSSNGVRSTTFKSAFPNLCSAEVEVSF